MNNKKLKPVVFMTTRYSKHSNNTFQQNLLLKALTVTHDPKKLKEMIGVRTVAEVYRTLDKMALRKDFHRALDKAEISMDFIVDGLKSLAVNSYKDADKLNAYKTLLKSIGLDKYEDSTQGGGSWEDALIKAVNKDKENDEESDTLDGEFYEVKQPRIPESVRQQKEEEKDLNHSLYG